MGLSRERLEEAYQFLLANPPLGLAVQRHGDELRLVTAPEVSRSVERHVNRPKPVGLSKAALEVLAIVAYGPPIARSGIEFIRGSASDSALDTLLERGLIEYNQHPADCDCAGISGPHGSAGPGRPTPTCARRCRRLHQPPASRS